MTIFVALGIPWLFAGARSLVELGNPSCIKPGQGQCLDLTKQGSEPDL